MKKSWACKLGFHQHAHEFFTDEASKVECAKSCCPKCGGDVMYSMRWGGRWVDYNSRTLAVHAENLKAARRLAAILVDLVFPDKEKPK